MVTGRQVSIHYFIIIIIVLRVNHTGDNEEDAGNYFATHAKHITIAAVKASVVVLCVLRLSL